MLTFVIIENSWEIKEVKIWWKNAANCCKIPLFDLENVLIIGLKY